MCSVTFRQIRLGTAEYSEALKLREDVLRKPLGLELSATELAADHGCFHLAGFEANRLIAILLLQPLTVETIKMRQVAVCPECQKCGIGSQLVEFAEQFARTNGYKQIVAHARETALTFYRKLGYAVAGETFLETTIPHRLVSREL